jgi:hypothetical protein
MIEKHCPHCRTPSKAYLKHGVCPHCGFVKKTSWGVVIGCAILGAGFLTALINYLLTY